MCHCRRVTKQNNAPAENGMNSVLERMVAEGRVRPATRAWQHLPPPIPRRPGEPTLTEVLLAIRDEEDR